MLIINLLLLGSIVFLVLVLSMVWPPDSPWAPWWKIDRKRASAAGKLGKIHKNDVVYELGSGDGEFLLQIAKEYKAKGVGIEIDPLRYWQSKLRAKLHKASSLTFIKQNYNTIALHEATVVFVYLVPRALERLKPKLLKELSPTTRIISYRYKMDLPLLTQDKKNQLYVYTIAKK